MGADASPDLVSTRIRAASRVAVFAVESLYMSCSSGMIPCLSHVRVLRGE